MQDLIKVIMNEYKNIDTYIYILRLLNKDNKNSLYIEIYEELKELIDNIDSNT